jgi:NADPH:quinone reductase-like Zn-dependent oxidoreductase
MQGPIVGTRVVFVDTWQTWREQIVCTVDRLVPVPDGLNDQAAATAYINPLTAWALTPIPAVVRLGPATFTCATE